MKTLSIDIETFSSANLAKCGVYKYVEPSDFEILLFGYSVDGGPVQVIDLASGETIPKEIIDVLTDENVTKWAFNANFERVCLSRYLNYPTGKYLKPSSWKCSMVWAATMGLPLSLEGVGSVLGLEKQKLTEGKDLIKYFCLPCSPTKANEHRTRNYPYHAPDKWLSFKQYNIRDVEVEMSVQAKLANFPVPDNVWKEYHLDQEINDRGVALDMVLVQKAIDMDSRSRSELTEAIKNLTGLDNPNSVQQMKQWLSKNGLETETLDKKTVLKLIQTAPPELRDVLSLRQQLAKSSVKKYQAMKNVVCSDGRARGMFQFYGANRTGRWAGRIIQLQNLPQNHLPDLEQARALVKIGDI
jgi:DNA polymerase